MYLCGDHVPHSDIQPTKQPSLVGCALPGLSCDADHQLTRGKGNELCGPHSGTHTHAHTSLKGRQAVVGVVKPPVPTVGHHQCTTARHVRPARVGCGHGHAPRVRRRGSSSSGHSHRGSQQSPRPHPAPRTSLCALQSQSTNLGGSASARTPRGPRCTVRWWWGSRAT